MAVRRAAGAQWAARRKAEKAAERATAEGDADGLRRTESEPLSVHLANAAREPKRRLRTAPPSEFTWDSSAYGMFPPPPPPYGMYPAPYMPSMYHPAWVPVPPMMGMPPMYPGSAYPSQGGGSPSSYRPQPGARRGHGKSANATSRGKSQEGHQRGKNSGNDDEETPKPRWDGVGGRGRRRGTHHSSDVVQTSGGDPATPGPVGATVDEVAPTSSEALTQVRRHGAQCDITLGQVMDEILTFARDRDGSQFLQVRLPQASEEDRQTVFETVLPEVAVLSFNVFGSVVVQKLFELGTHAQNKALIEELRTQLLKCANDAYGCRVLQAAIQNIPRESQQMVVAELEKDVAGCIQSMHGNHVIQKCIEQMSPDSLGFIISIVEERTEEVASHKYGCRVVQRLLEHCRMDQLKKILEELIHSTPKLAQDFYGNYVVQHMLQHGRREDKSRIMAIVQGEITFYAKHRFSSNVVEKCIEVATTGEHAHALEEEREALLKAILGEPASERPPLLPSQRPPVLQMTEDRFGMHVVQCVLEHSRCSERELMFRQLECLQGQPPTTNGRVQPSRRVIAALQKEFGQSPSTV